MKRCENCDEVIDTGEWYPVTVPEDFDAVVPFCSEACLEEWTEQD